MRKILHTALGILTSVGGFLEIASLVTATQGGPISGRGMRSARLGLPVFAAALLGLGVTSLLVLGADITGLAVALELASGTTFRLWGLAAGRQVRADRVRMGTSRGSPVGPWAPGGTFTPVTRLGGNAGADAGSHS